MDYKYLKCNKNIDGSIFEIILNNPSARNALNAEMLDEMIDCLQKIKKQRKTRIIILTGNGEAFSAGADLEWMQKSINLSFEENKKDALKFSKMLQLLDSIYCPTIAIVNGHAFGGALGIISVCDFVIADENSKFCFSEVKLGLIPAMIGPYIIRSIGFKNSKKLFLTGEIFDSNYATKINLIDIAVSKKQIISEKEKIIKNLLLGGPKAQEEVKDFLINAYLKDIDNKLIIKTAEIISKIRTSKEGQNGIKAFLNKTKPNWKNELS